MMSISSRPKLPPSPACGLSAATAMRGGTKPAPRSAAVVSSSAVTIPSIVSMAGTLESGTCEVTRAFQSPSRMLNSLAAPLVPSTPAVKPISSS